MKHLAPFAMVLVVVSGCLPYGHVKHAKREAARDLQCPEANITVKQEELKNGVGSISTGDTASQLRATGCGKTTVYLCDDSRCFPKPEAIVSPAK